MSRFIKFAKGAMRSKKVRKVAYDIGVGLGTGNIGAIAGLKLSQRKRRRKN